MPQRFISFSEFAFVQHILLTSSFEPKPELQVLYSRWRPRKIQSAATHWEPNVKTVAGSYIIRDNRFVSPPLDEIFPPSGKLWVKHEFFQKWFSHMPKMFFKVGLNPRRNKAGIEVELPGPPRMEVEYWAEITEKDVTT